MSGVYWGLAGSVGTRARRGIGHISRHLVVPRGVGTIRGVRGHQGM